MSGDVNVNLELLSLTRQKLDNVSGFDENSLISVSIGYLQQVEGEITRLADELTQMQDDFASMDTLLADVSGELNEVRIEQWGGAHD